MALLAFKSPLTSRERLQRRRLMLQDALALFSLFLATVLVGILTWLLFRSFDSHQKELAARWLRRGETALRQGRPQQAIDALRSALAYAPGQRSIEIELAEALASAGRTQEAAAYFNTLLESEPGSGNINLQLARLAARQGNTQQAFDDYQRSIYGNWEGDGYIRRRQVRLELVSFLMANRLETQARNELIVAAGNASLEDTPVQLQIGALMEQAHDLPSALHLYRTLLQHNPGSLAALEGAGRAAFASGHFLLAKRYLERAEAARAGSHGEKQTAPEAERQEDLRMLQEASRLLQLYPSPALSAGARAQRILAGRQIARARLASCAEGTQGARAPEDAVGMEDLAARWQQETKAPTSRALAADPDLAQRQIQLLYDTEQITSRVCGQPTGDDALLLKIAQAPDAVEQL